MKEEDRKEDGEEEEEEPTVICRGCGFSGHPDNFDACLSVYHDLKCPECGTTDIKYSYGSYINNTLITNTDRKK